MTRFLIKDFGQEAVVFDSASGDTHYLSPLAYMIFKTSHEQPGMTYHQTPHTLALALDVEPDEQLERLANEAVNSLKHIGLLKIK